MEKPESLLDEIFDARLDVLANITKEERAEINEMKKIIETEKFFSDATKEEIEKIEEFVDNVNDNMACEMGFLNEKYYKIGFADGVKLMIECIKR